MAHTPRAGSWRRAGLTAASLALLAGGLAACGQSGAATVEAAEPDPHLVFEGALTVCSDTPYKPFEFKQHGQHVGFDIDLAQAVADRLEVQLDIVDLAFDDIISGEALNADVCDVAISAMTINGERARVLDFSSPYFDAKQALLVPTGSDITDIASLSGEKVAVQGDTTSEAYLRDFAPAGAQVVAFADATELKNALFAGEVDAAFIDNTVVGDIAGGTGRYEVATELDTGEQYGMAVKKDGNTDLLRVINAVLADLRADGGYDQIYNTWFGTKG